MAVCIRFIVCCFIRYAETVLDICCNSAFVRALVVVYCSFWVWFWFRYHSVLSARTLEGPTAIFVEIFFRIALLRGRFYEE